jgi:hypothetical protein
MIMQPNATQKRDDTLDGLEGAEFEDLDGRLQIYVDFCAVGGLIIDEAGEAELSRPMKVTELAEKLGVNRATIWRWQKLPGFWDLVDKRSKIIFTEKRKYLVWRGLLAKAIKGDVPAATMVLSHYTDYKPPAQKVEATLEVKGLGDLVQAALMAKRKVIDADFTEKPVITG